MTEVVRTTHSKVFIGGEEQDMDPFYAKLSEFYADFDVLQVESEKEANEAEGEEHGFRCDSVQTEALTYQDAFYCETLLVLYLCEDLLIV
eukprot:TRINITY_DN2292_c0_g1_i12.p1 TRINITY_DN2292_c0_g1~~TRINITY_DN2292_c0_g1_i12.p1  ORF type:complete len:103 (-),score=26.57 TRINITY_DN2292_c0_g1_i12:130-399(-)